jgi:hypothetical protein
MKLNIHACVNLRFCLNEVTFKMIFNFNYKKSLFGLLLIISFPFVQVLSQDDATWWNETHHWDGITSWTQYIIYSPYYMGPNALSVPFSPKGFVRDQFELKMNLEGHFSKGDKTQNIFLDCYIPLIKNKVAVEFYGVPVEHYNMDEPTVIERRGRNRDGEDYAVGDFYFSTIFQLIKNKKMPDLSLRMACKTASGSHLSDARNTDAPGYFFDLSLGKDVLFTERFIKKIRLHGMIGFYSWQMNLPENRQNDAILYGAGVDMAFSGFYLNNSVEGFSGYFGKERIVVGDKEEPVSFRDRPTVYRLDLMKETNRIDFGLGYQAGLNDFNYQSLKISIVYHILLR